MSTTARISGTSLHWSLTAGELEITRKFGVGYRILASHAALMLWLCWGEYLSIFALCLPFYLQGCFVFLRRRRIRVNNSGIDIFNFWWCDHFPREAISKLVVTRGRVDSTTLSTQESLAFVVTGGQRSICLISEYARGSSEELGKLCASANKILGVDVENPA